jgi:hypothetical protein
MYMYKQDKVEKYVRTASRHKSFLNSICNIKICWFPSLKGVSAVKNDTEYKESLCLILKREVSKQ